MLRCYCLPTLTSSILMYTVPVISYMIDGPRVGDAQRASHGVKLPAKEKYVEKIFDPFPRGAFFSQVAAGDTA